jgi:hypothetical protein
MTPKSVRKRKGVKAEGLHDPKKCKETKKGKSRRPALPQKE